MRTISTNGLTKLTQRLGTEPIIIVEVDWGRDGVPISYADKAVGSIPGKILQVGSLDNIVNVQSSSNSQSIDLTLDDSDGSLKAIIDSQDIHEVDARVYQYFSGLDLSDKFLVFAGKVNSPIKWSEADRTLSLSILNQLEDLETGFSPEEGEVIGLSADMIGRPWPMVFGKVLDVPALQVSKAVTGSTLTQLGVVTGKDAHLAAPLGSTDCSFGSSIASAQTQISVRRIAAEKWAVIDPVKASQLIEQANAAEVQINSQLGNRVNQITCATNTRATIASDAESLGLGPNPLRVLGGEDFPQGQPLTLNINGALFTGSMSGQDFTITSRTHPDGETRLAEKLARVTETACSQPTPSQAYDYSEQVPPGSGDFSNSSMIRRHGFVICDQPTVTQPTVDSLLEVFQIQPGARVTIEDGENIVYIASITPGAVLAVKAYKQFEGERRLVDVPGTYYTIGVIDLGVVQAKAVVFDKLLSARAGENWSDEVYVTYSSTIGPNVRDVLEHLVTTYTGLEIDETSFDAIETATANFPVNFAVLDRRNTLELIKQIAFESRLAVWVSNGTVFAKYLPVEPDADLTITMSDIELGSIETSTVSSEDLVTKMVVEYQQSLADDEKLKIIIRNNVGKYGTKERTFEWLTHNGADVIYHIASFWSLRLSTSWKRISFRGMLPLLRLETYDTVLIDLPGVVAAGSVKAIVESATYDSESNSVALACLVPVVSGAMEKHPLFWSGSSSASYPTRFDQPGGSGIGALAAGTLPVGDLSHLGINTNGPFQGGPNAIFNPKSDRGKTNQNDSAFTPSPVVIESAYAGASPGATNEIFTGLNFVAAAGPVVLNLPSTSSVLLDIRTTKIFDRDNPLVGAATLDSIIRGITSGDLVLSTSAKVGDDTHETTFDFKYDSDSGKFGAGTAFLKD